MQGVVVNLGVYPKLHVHSVFPESKANEFSGQGLHTFEPSWSANV